MLRQLIVVLFTGFFGLTATVIQANTVERIFPAAEQVGKRQENNLHYLLPLGRVKEDRVAGRVQPSRFDRLQGDLIALTWRLESDLTLLDAKRQVDDYLSALNADRLFYCESRDCGESFSWANQIFQQPVLFGSDRNQYLWVVQDRGQPRYHVFYLIERPNRRIYLHEDTLTVPLGLETADQIVQMLDRNGRVRVADVSLAGDKADFSKVIDRLKGLQSAVNRPLLLVLHRHGEARQLEQLAGDLRRQLDGAGLTAQVEDVGPLAPDANASALVWVEWVNQEWRPAGL